MKATSSRKQEMTDSEMKSFTDALAGLTPEQRAAKLEELAREHAGIEIDPDGAQKRAQTMVKLELSDSQLKEILAHSVDGAKGAIKAIQTGAQLKYGFDAATAKETSEKIVEGFMGKLQKQRETHGMIAKHFQSIFHLSRGAGNRGTYIDLHKREADYLGRHTMFTKMLEAEGEERAMSLGTDTTGGYLAPELWVTEVYEALAQTSLARRLATLIEMDRETLKLPKITTGLTAAIVAELTAATPQQGVFAQFQLTPQKLVVLTKAFSHELLINADPAIIPLLTHLATIAFGRKEDEMMFVGADASVTGWLENTQNPVSMSAGEDAITDVDFDDFADLENAIDEQYMPDADVTNSGGIGGEAAYFFNKKVINVLRKLKGNDNYYWADVSGETPKTIHGHPYHRVPDMPSAPAAATGFAAFGNPKYTYFGYRPGIYVDVLKEATVDSVDMAASAGQALRLIEYVDTKLIDNEATALLKTGAAS